MVGAGWGTTECFCLFVVWRHGNLVCYRADVLQAGGTRDGRHRMSFDIPPIFVLFEPQEVWHNLQKDLIYG